MRLSLVVEAGDSIMNGAVESVEIGEGMVGEIMLLEVTPASFDVVHFGRVLGQPFEGEKGAWQARAWSACCGGSLRCRAPRSGAGFVRRYHRRRRVGRAR